MALLWTINVPFGPTLCFGPSISNLWWERRIPFDPEKEATKLEFKAIIKHPLMPLVNASISTVIFVWAIGPFSTTAAVLLIMLTWVWSIRRVVRRAKARRVAEILLIAAILGGFGTVAITPEPVEAQSIGSCSYSRAAAFWGAVGGAIMGGVKGAIVGAATGALASTECDDWYTGPSAQEVLDACQEQAANGGWNCHGDAGVTNTGSD